jgi:hypothetical protein
MRVRLAVFGVIAMPVPLDQEPNSWSQRRIPADGLSVRSLGSAAPTDLANEIATVRPMTSETRLRPRPGRRKPSAIRDCRGGGADANRGR